MSTFETERSERLEFAGKVKVWLGEKGYGFIRNDGGEDVFVHQSVLQRAGLQRLAAGDRVVLDTERVADGRIRCTKIALEPRPPAAA
jgi:CspA family cold shock protein